MKAKNSKEITAGYLKCSAGMLVSVLLAIASAYGLIATGKTEFTRIRVKTDEYDRIYRQQTELTNKMDSLYTYMSLFNSEQRINDVMLMSVIGSHKVEFTESLQRIDSKDVPMYRILSEELNRLMSLKDSIRVARTEKEMVGGDLQRCIRDNRQAVRKLSLGGMVIEQPK